MPIVWIDESVVFALHEEHLAEHGGAIVSVIVDCWNPRCIVREI